MEQSSFKGLWGTGGLSKGALSVGSATARSPMASSSKPRLRPALHTWEGEPPSHSGPKWRLHCGREARSIITSRRCAQGALPGQVDVAPVPGQTSRRERQGAAIALLYVDVLLHRVPNDFTSLLHHHSPSPPPSPLPHPPPHTPHTSISIPTSTPMYPTRCFARGKRRCSICAGLDNRKAAEYFTHE